MQRMGRIALQAGQCLFHHDGTSCLFKLFLVRVMELRRFNGNVHFNVFVIPCCMCQIAHV